MSAPLRFLGLAVFAWAGVRAASLSLFPGSTALVPPAAAAAPAVPARSEPVAMMAEPASQPFAPAGYPYPPYPYPPYPAYSAPQQPIVIPAGWGGRPQIVYAAYPAPPRPSQWNLGPEPYRPPGPIERVAYSELPPLSGSPRPAPGGIATSPPPGPPRLDRWQLSAWGLIRRSPGPVSLASNGTLGGSQAGARVLYRFTPALAASLRFSSGNGGLGAEVAGGIRWQPLRSIPVAITAERRQGLGKYGGRDDFALFAEGGLYRQPLVGSWTLDGYAQGGLVGIKARDLFADGALTVSRPLWRNFSGGLGIWGGVQPGLYRVDGGPRLTMDMGRGIRVHADYRQRLAGNALPASGPALTVAGDW